MLKINILLFVKIMYINLSPIIESEASINGNYYIFKTIFFRAITT